MTLTTRKPTGKPSWPIVLLAGREKAGKSWAAIAATASPLVGRALYIGAGEDDPDEYSLIPGADFEIVEHDGTYRGILQAVTDAVHEPQGDLPTLIILDSATRVWNLLSDNVQAIANQRARGRRNAATGDYSVTPDLWNAAASMWGDIIQQLQSHQGPVIITARLEPVTVMENGQPTAAKEWKIQGHKTLPFDASAVVEMHARGHFLLTGVRSVMLQLPAPEVWKDFTIATLWDRLGITDGTGDRNHAGIVPDTAGLPANKPSAAERIAKADAALRGTGDRATFDRVWSDVVKSGLDGIPELVKTHDEMIATFPEREPVDHWAVAEIPTDKEQS